MNREIFELQHDMKSDFSRVPSPAHSRWVYRPSQFYYRGLSEWETEKGWLTDTCLDGQDTFKRLLAMFDL